jgi:hypothetical protein
MAVQRAVEMLFDSRANATSGPSGAVRAMGPTTNTGAVSEDFTPAFVLVPDGLSLP